MAIDAQVKTVVVGRDGKGHLELIDRPPSVPGKTAGIAGQNKLYFDEAPENVYDLEGQNIWGGSSFIMLGNKEIAKRTGYETIEFVVKKV